MTELLVNAAIGEMRIAMMRDGRLEDFQVARDSEKQLTGNVYLGRVTKVMAAMQAAFVEIGEARAGFLALGEVRHLSDKTGPRISDCVREGETLVVEAIREGEGDKGPRLTAKVALAPIADSRGRTARAPALLQATPSLLERVLAGLPPEGVRIAIDEPRVAAAARRWCRDNRPDLESAIETAPIVFDDALEEEIARLFAPRLALEHGGWITIEAAEGFTAIDVNSGSFAASGGRRQTSLAVNLEAAQEIGRQIRLRGIGGLIVADFIQMQDAASTRLVEAVLTESLEGAVPAEVTLSRTGLAVITRKRARAPLSRFSEPCAVCCGTGAQLTAESVALALLRAAERSARAAPGRALTVRAAPEVIEWLTAHARADALERRGLARLGFESRSGSRESFDVFIR
jgi:ribonuclease G